ncbi:MAG: hypothetical protein ACREQM_00855 [Candidatus Dormibacteraceae bacterium]
MKTAGSWGSSPSAGPATRSCGDVIGYGWPFVAFGAGCVVAGGLVAAAGGVSPSASVSWAAAYLVLVAGVAQVALGLGTALLSRRSAPRAPRNVELGCWNLGNAGVLVGTLCQFEVVLVAASLLLLVALALFAYWTRRPPGTPWWLPLGYRVLLAILALSVPAGVFLARTP